METLSEPNPALLDAAKTTVALCWEQLALGTERADDVLESLKAIAEKRIRTPARTN
jgi:hypothetical protein